MGQIDTFGSYVIQRLEDWGREFALHRDLDYLGHQSKNMLQVLIEHRGEMPPRNTGYKPLEVSQPVQQLEDIVAGIARQNLTMACTLRAYYCGMGRKRFERFETSNLLITNAGLPIQNCRQYLAQAELGLQAVREKLSWRARAAA